jgi:hypothetical protein
MMPHCGVSLLMHRSMLVSHSESLVASNEYSTVVTIRYCLMPLVTNVQGNVKSLLIIRWPLVSRGQI